MLLFVALAGFVMFKKKYAIITLIFLVFHIVLVVILNAYFFFLSVKLKGLVVQSTPLQTQSIWVLMTVSKQFKPFD